ncbi:MAG: nucleotidyl transferase AbiEii/AbiGii toxin family protein [Candidatus Acidiferrales bacterium]
MPHKLKNLAASVRQKLLDLARSRNEDFGLILVKYGLERILYRLSRSKHRDTFVLKGALLFELWTKHTYRATRDAGFLARGDNSPERFVGIFKELCVIEVEPDGLTFDADSVKAERITEDADYEGVRVTFTARLERARIPIQIDIGFGDAITPAPLETQYPTLLPAPNPRLLTYPKETVVAEKFEAMVKLGIANSRMKDFYDLEALSRNLDFDGKMLGEAIRKTFERRGTELPAGGTPVAFTPEFYTDTDKKKQCAAFGTRNATFVTKTELKEVVGNVKQFLTPVATALLDSSPFTKRWEPGGPWH